MELEERSNSNTDITFGNTHEFACRINLDDNMFGEWMMGRVCFWLFGEMIGDYASSVSLRDTMLAMGQVVEEKGRRHHDYFFHASASEFYDRVHCSMFGDSPNPDDVRLMYDEEWGRFLIDIPISAYSSEIIYLIEGEEKDRVILIEANQAECKDFLFPSGLFYDIISQAYTHLAKIFAMQ